MSLYGGWGYLVTTVKFGTLRLSWYFEFVSASSKNSFDSFGSLSFVQMENSRQIPTRRRKCARRLFTDIKSYTFDSKMLAVVEKTPQLWAKERTICRNDRCQRQIFDAIAWQAMKDEQDFFTKDNGKFFKIQNFNISYDS